MKTRRLVTFRGKKTRQDRLWRVLRGGAAVLTLGVLLLALAPVPGRAALFFSGNAHVLRKQGTIPCGVDSVASSETWAFWIRRHTTNAGAICGLNLSAAFPREFGFYFSATRTNALSFFYLSSGAVNQEFATAPSVFADSNVWHHVAFTFTYGTGSSAQWYVDGLPVAGAWVAGNGNVLAALNTTTAMTIGTDKVNDSFQGAITDFVRLAGMRITSQQAFTLARSRLKITPVALVPTVYSSVPRRSMGYYQFDELPAFTTQSGTTTNTIIERSSWSRPGGLTEDNLRSSGSTASNCVVWPERVTSYQPNN